MKTEKVQSMVIREQTDLADLHLFEELAFKEKTEKDANT